MINFNDIKYERIDYFKTKIKLEKLFKQLNKSTNYKEFLELFKQINAIQNHIEEMYDLVDINNMRNQNDSFYEDEINYWNQFKPKFDLLFVSFYQIILNSKYLPELKKIIPDNFFRIIETRVNKGDVSDLEIKEIRIK